MDLKRIEMNARDGDTLALAKWRILNRLHDRNETMYYKVSDYFCKIFLREFIYFTTNILNTNYNHIK